MTRLQRSRYLLISPHRYTDADGQPVRMAYATRTARVITVDDATAKRVAAGELESIPDEQLADLVDARALVPRDEDELAAVVGHLDTGSRDLSLRQITIMPTAYCNMACGYCGQEHYKAAVDVERVRRTAERVERVIADPAVTTVRVTWFGGEPLLALRVIREMSERFVAAAAAHGTAYTANMATNGSLLTRRTLDMLYQVCHLRSMDVTLDGPAEMHDARRLMRDGRGTFHRTLAVLAEALTERRLPDLRLNVRVNIDSGNEDTVPDLLLDLVCMGFASPQVRLHLMPVHSWGNDVSTVALGSKHYAAREAEWLALAQQWGIDFPVLPVAVKRATCLATMHGGELLDSGGRVYSCSEHPLVPGARETGVVARVEDLAGSNPRPAGQFDDWYTSVAEGDVQCARCPLLPVCGGGCPKLWRDGHVPCPSMKHNWIERLDIAAGRLGCAREAE